MKVCVVMVSLLFVVKSQKNLSQNGTASQSSTFHWESKRLNLTSDLAITGGRTHDIYSESCAVTVNRPTQYEAWWMLTFPVDTIYITNVLIYFGSRYNNRLAGYSLYVSNSSTTKTDGYLCYHHTGPGLPTSALQNVNCNHLGQYVIFYNERDEGGNNHARYSHEAMILLCNIEVNGCYKGWWDSSCSKRCPPTCVAGHCYPGNGSCVWGCNPDNCLNDRCDTTTGKCTDGCEIGLRGDYCDRACASGTFGNQCSTICHCVNQPCNHTNGTCPPGGCQRGYKGNTCSTVCESGTFGNDCSSNCHCVNQTCDPEHGICPVGECQRGYKGITCSTECSHGYYGFNCSESCDGCLSDSCDKEHGVCTDTSGCKPKRQLEKCECVSGTFGNNCSSNCHCFNQPCDPKGGTCPVGGCERGYKGSTCSTECTSGDYGFDCENHCRICINSSCERYDGLCTYGCIKGLKGLQCQTSVRQTASDNTMNMVYTGVVTFIVSTLMCVIIVLAILRYRRNKKDGNTKKQGGNKSTGFNNNAFTNDYVNTGFAVAHNNETHYEDIMHAAQEQEETYDTI